MAEQKNIQILLTLSEAQDFYAFLHVRQSYAAVKEVLSWLEPQIDHQIKVRDMGRAGHRTEIYGQSSADGYFCRECGWQASISLDQRTAEEEHYAAATTHGPLNVERCQEMWPDPQPWWAKVQCKETTVHAVEIPHHGYSTVISKEVIW